MNSGDGIRIYLGRSDGVDFYLGNVERAALNYATELTRGKAVNQGGFGYVVHRYRQKT